MFLIVLIAALPDRSYGRNFTQRNFKVCTIDKKAELKQTRQVSSKPRRGFQLHKNSYWYTLGAGDWPVELCISFDLRELQQVPAKFNQHHQFSESIRRCRRTVLNESKGERNKHTRTCDWWCRVRVCFFSVMWCMLCEQHIEIQFNQNGRGSDPMLLLVLLL